MKFSTQVKEVLRTKIREVAACSWLFVRNPGRDITRKRKLDFETMLQCLITMESGSLQKELLENFNFDLNTPTASAFVQQREKILPEAFEFLFQSFNDALSNTRHTGNIACLPATEPL